MTGKSKCKILKQIRQKIADENDIPYVTSECSYKGECKGTCPKCEAELRYLEQELDRKRQLGKAVAVAAVAAGLSLSLVACTPRGNSDPNGGEPAPITTRAPDTGPEIEGNIETMPVDEGEELAGDVEVQTTPATDATGD